MRPSVEAVAERFRSPGAERRAREGEWLFRWRSYIPLPLLFALAVRVYLNPSKQEGSLPLEWGWDGLCLAAGLAGVSIRVWVAGLVPAGTSGRTTEDLVASQLNTTGPYSVARHPLYVGNFLMWMAVALFSRSPALVLLTAIYFWGFYLRIMAAEDRFLLTRFGDTFLEWAQTTPAVIPAWSQWRPADLRYSWRTAVLREYTGLVGLVFALGFLDFIEETSLADRPRLGVFWAALLACAAGLYLLVRILKEQTTWLEVPGR